MTKGVATNVLVAIDTGSRRPVKILRARPTRHFLFLLVRCRCGKKFGHRADRPNIVCFHCGRMAALRDLGNRRSLGRAALKLAPLGARARALKPTRRFADSRTVRRSAPAPARRQSAR